jgi:septal ring factor EnvC (AmiA/AmiB activator)
MKGYNLKTIIPLIIIILCECSVSFTQSRQELEKQRNQINKDIERTSKELESTRKSKQKNIAALKAIESQVNSRKQLINVIKTEVAVNDRKLEENTQKISQLQGKHKILNDQYMRMLRISYLKKQSHSPWTYLLSSESLNNLLLRWRYLKQFELFTRQKIGEIIITKGEIVLKNQEIQSLKLEKESSLQEAAQNMKTLESEQKLKDEIVKKLSSTELSLAAKLKKREGERENLNASIERVIVAELSRSRVKEKDDVAAVKKKEIDNTDFSKNRGSLPWPVNAGKITSKFGTHAHPTYSNLEVSNNGIDITMPSAGSVQSVFDGEISGVINIPGYNNVVMVKHGSYMTIYAKLSSVSVGNGQKIKRGQKIGNVSADEDGNVVFHFELWKDKVKLNPQNWLGK